MQFVLHVRNALCLVILVLTCSEVCSKRFDHLKHSRFSRICNVILPILEHVNLNDVPADICQSHRDSLPIVEGASVVARMGEYCSTVVLPTIIEEMKNGLRKSQGRAQDISRICEEVSVRFVYPNQPHEQPNEERL